MSMIGDGFRQFREEHLARSHMARDIVVPTWRQVAFRSEIVNGTALEPLVWWIWKGMAWIRMDFGEAR